MQQGNLSVYKNYRNNVASDASTLFAKKFVEISFHGEVISLSNLSIVALLLSLDKKFIRSLTIHSNSVFKVN